MMKQPIRLRLSQR